MFWILTVLTNHSVEEPHELETSLPPPTSLEQACVHKEKKGCLFLHKRPFMCVFSSL